MDEVLAAVIQLYNRVVTFVYETSLLDIRVATARFTDERLASFFYTRSKLTHETLRRHTVAQFVQILSKNCLFVCNRGDTTQYQGSLLSRELGQATMYATGVPNS